MQASWTSPSGGLCSQHTGPQLCTQAPAKEAGQSWSHAPAVSSTFSASCERRRSYYLMEEWKPFRTPCDLCLVVSGLLGKWMPWKR